MVRCAFNILLDKSAVLGLNLGVVFPETINIVYHKTSLCPDDKGLYILNIFGDVGSKMSPHRVALFDSLENVLQLVGHSLKLARGLELLDAEVSSYQILQDISCRLYIFCTYCAPSLSIAPLLINFNTEGVARPDIEQPYLYLLLGLGHSILSETKSLGCPL